MIPHFPPEGYDFLLDKHGKTFFWSVDRHDVDKFIKLLKQVTKDPSCGLWMMVYEADNKPPLLRIQVMSFHPRFEGLKEVAFLDLFSPRGGPVQDSSKDQGS
jgi:hypothetical protein